MIAVRIVGGLGNQMYGYALYRALLALGKDVRMDLSSWSRRKDPILDKRKYLLSEVFNIEERPLNPILSFIMRAGVKLGLVNDYQDKGGFQPEVFGVKNGMITGYWCSFKYCAGIEDILRSEFTFRQPLAGRSADVIEEIKNCNSVSISFRRGDYLNLGWALPMEYYTRAIRYIQERVPDAKFFCTSDDINWCKSVLNGRGYRFIDWSEGDDQYIDLRIISSCKHNILANSTFCLWGSWLNTNPGRIVLRPDKYTLEHPGTKDLWPSDWISIPAWE